MAGEDTATVLVVEDQANVAEAYALWLDDRHTVHTASDGAAALEQLDESIDVVLLDRLMPGLSGDEVLERIRAEGYACRVAMVTAVDPDFDVLDMPFDSYLVKPVSAETLNETVEELLTIGSFDERSRELFAIAQKRAAIEAEKDRSALAEHAEYAELTERFDSLQADLDEQLAGMDDQQIATALDDATDDTAS